MKPEALELLRFPIGKFSSPQPLDKARIEAWIADIARFPDLIQHAVSNLSEPELSLIFRPGGWTIRQLVHHCADSHVNAWVRFRLSLTETTPTIRPYDENLWSALADNQEALIDHSLNILQGIHARWADLMGRMGDQDWEKSYYHPANDETVKLKNALGMYVWHGQHHLAHIRQALQYRGQFPEK